MTGWRGPWPPLIVAKNVPRSVKWRDALLTLSAWVAFALLLIKELVWALTGNGEPAFERLTPFLLIAAVLAGLLMIFSLRTLQRRRRSLLLPQSAPLEAADEARRTGLDEAALIAARDERVVTVHTDDGGIWIETKNLVYRNSEGTS